MTTPAHLWGWIADVARPRLVGTLGITDSIFVDGAGNPTLPIAIHAGDLFCAELFGLERQVEAAFDRFAEAGYDIWRTWATLNWARRSDSWWAPRYLGPGVTDRYWERLEAHVRHGVARGLKVHLAPGDLRDIGDGRENGLFDGIADLMARVGPEHFALVEGLNEARDTGDRDDAVPAEIERLVNRIRARHPANLYALSAYTGTEDRLDIRRWTPTWMRMYLYHQGRAGHVADKVRHAFSMGYEDPVRRLGWSGEPFGPNPPGRSWWVSGVEHAEELDDEAMALWAAMALIARQVPTFMSSPGVRFEADAPFESMSGFWSVPRVRDILPRDLMRFQTLCHSGESQRGTRVLCAAGEGDSLVRVDGAIAADGRFAFIIYGAVPGDWVVGLVVERRCELTTIHPATREAFGPVQYWPGDTVGFRFRHGRIVTGRLR